MIRESGLRQQRFVATHFSSGRIFYATPGFHQGVWAGFTCASMKNNCHEDLRCAGTLSVKYENYSNDIAIAEIIQLLVEDAASDPRNKYKIWPPQNEWGALGIAPKLR